MDGQSQEALNHKVVGEQKPIVVTLGHPFFVYHARSNTSAEGESKGEGSWIWSRDLKAGELLKTWSGERRAIISISLLNHGAPTFNFEVAKNHDYFVGQSKLLVHNQSIKISPVAEDWVTKGAHIKVNGVELAVRPDINGGVVFKPVFSSTTAAEANSAANIAQSALTNNSQFRNALYRTAQHGVEYLGNHPSELGRGRSGEVNFLLKALDKIP